MLETAKSETNTAKQKNGLSKLDAFIKKYRKVAGARLHIYRVKPEESEGVKYAGFTTRWDCSEFKTGREVFERIKKEFGGHIWDVKLQAPNDAGFEAYVGSARIETDAPPKLEPAAKEAKAGDDLGSIFASLFGGNRTPQPPAAGKKNDALLKSIDEILNQQKEAAQKAREESEKLQREMLQRTIDLMKDIRGAADTDRKSNGNGHGGYAHSLVDQIESLTKKLEEANTKLIEERRNSMDMMREMERRHADRMEDHRQAYRRDVEGLDQRHKEEVQKVEERGRALEQLHLREMEHIRTAMQEQQRAHQQDVMRFMAERVLVRERKAKKR